MSAWLAFVLGYFLGGLMGFFAAALCRAAKEGDTK